jgi:hypothetical protein
MQRASELPNQHTRYLFTNLIGFVKTLISKLNILKSIMFYEGDLRSGINTAIEQSKLVACYVRSQGR